MAELGNAVALNRLGKCLSMSVGNWTTSLITNRRDTPSAVLAFMRVGVLYGNHQAWATSILL